MYRYVACIDHSGFKDIAQTPATNLLYIVTAGALVSDHPIIVILAYVFFDTSL